MSRRNKAVKREILPDPVFKDIVVTKFINNIMLAGKKSCAEKIFYGALEKISTKLAVEAPIEIFKKAMENVKPQVEVKSRRVGGSNFQVPIEVSPVRKQALSIRWLINYAKLRNEKSMTERLAGELIDAYNKKGGAFKKKEDVFKMAEANRAFSHFKY
jgi:small subunit ribosomal protein S7